MSYLYRYVSVVLLLCILVLSVFNCRKIERIKGEKLELPVKQWVPLKSTEEPYQVKYDSISGDLLYFTCNKRILNAEQKQIRAVAEGKIGDMLVFGRTEIHYRYDQFNPKVKKERVTFFRIRLLELNEDSSVVTIVVLPEDFQNK